MTGVLITGGAGFVGSNLTAYLHSLGGYDITVLDNESLGRREDIAEFDVRFIRGDILDRAALAQALEGAEIVIHLAADTRVIDSIENPVRNFETNVVGTFRLFDLARTTGIRRILNASTGGAIVGAAPAPVHEEMVARPLSPYGASKLAAEGYASAFGSAYGMSIASLRFSNIYGPRSFHKGSVVAHFFKGILGGEPLTVYGDGEQVRDFLFVDDLVQGIHQAMTADIDGVFQLGTGQPTSINELITAIRDVVGPSHPVTVRHRDSRAGEVLRTWCDIGKARQAFGFAPGTPLSEGLQRTWNWFTDVYRIKRLRA